MEQLLSHETHNNHIDSDDYLNQVKQEPPDIGSQKMKQTFEAMKHILFTTFFASEYVIWICMTFSCKETTEIKTNL